MGISEKQYGREPGHGLTPSDGTRLVSAARGRLSPEDLRQAVGSAFGEIREGLEHLVSIPSVSAAGYEDYEPDEVCRSAEEAGSWLQRSGLRGVRPLNVDGAHPAVFGHTPGPAGSPTVLLYAHHDVQPPGTVDLWVSSPFEATERNGRLFGRGTADDKAGIAAHVAALQAWEGRPPVNISVFIEGEEEIASPNLPAFLEKYADLLRADVIVLADCSNWELGRPALTTSLRGIIDFIVEVQTLDHAVHSGTYGGPLPDALTALSRLITSLHDDQGNVTINGLHSGPPYDVKVDEAEFRRCAGVLDGVTLMGTGTLAHRLWGRPAVAVLGIDAPPTIAAANKLVPVARAKVSVRLAPGDDPAKAKAAIEGHFLDPARAPWGAKVNVTFLNEGAPHLIDASGGAFASFREACRHTWGCSPVEAGSGGSLPLVAALADAFPRAELLLTGVADPESRAHSENESVHLAELMNCCVNEAILLGQLARDAQA
jgi:acetylornithine deacetylase/succinyl-diaminopimelate desuccinylase-like protein